MITALSYLHSLNISVRQEMESVWSDFVNNDKKSPTKSRRIFLLYLYEKLVGVLATLSRMQFLETVNPSPLSRRSSYTLSETSLITYCVSVTMRARGLPICDSSCYL